MKSRVLAIFAGVLLAGTLSAQTLTDVINEFNTGVEKVNAQEYVSALEHFNQVLSMAEVVGDEANDMKAQAEKLIPSTYYRQATTYMKRKQYDNAIPNLEKQLKLLRSSITMKRSAKKLPVTFPSCICDRSTRSGRIKTTMPPSNILTRCWP
jgi:tetratricopeptide (TPR) repeat protein